MNLVLVIIDTLRYDFVGANGGPHRIETPNLDHLASESLVFDRAFAASFPTIPFRTDVMTGRYGNPFHTWKPLPHADWTFLDGLKAKGYATQLIHDTPHLVNGGHNFDYPFHAWTFVRGAEVDRAWVDDGVTWLPNWKRDPLFDCLDDPAGPHFSTYSRTNRGRREDGDWNCAKLFETAARFLSDNRNRDDFFLWVDCFDPHEPWDAPPQFVRRYDPRPDADGTIDPRLFFGRGRNHPDLTDEGRAVIRSHYAAKTAWMDHCFGRFLDAFYATGLSKNTTLIVVGDHGTKLGEYGRFGKGFPVRDLEAHVPLMVRRPGGESGRSSDFVQPQDLTATLLALGSAGSHEQVVGRDILSGSDKRPCAIAGTAPPRWNPGYFSVFGGDHWLEWTPAADASILRPYLSEENVTADHPKIVSDLHALGRSQIEARGAHPGLLRWLDAGGEGDLPEDVPLFHGWPGVPGFTQYFNRNLDD